MEITPITPQEAKDNRIATIHPTILKIVNDLIIKKCSDSSFSIKLEEITGPFFIQYPELQESAFNDKMFDIEDTYRKAGWKVEFDSPGYNESYSAFFKFKSK